MISQDRDYEDILRDALRAAAESVEPAGDGLERIRHRSHSRRSARSILAQAADWLRLFWIRLIVRLESLRWGLSQELSEQPPAAHSWSAQLVTMAGRLAAPRQYQGRHGTGQPGNDGRTPAGKTAGRLGPAAAWLRPTFAVAGAVAIVAVGAFALNRVQETEITPTNLVTSPPRQHPPAVAGRATPKLWQSPPSAVQPGQQATVKSGNKTATGAPTCTPAPKASKTPGPTSSPSATPTPTMSNTGSPTPSVTPTSSSSPYSSPATGSGGTPRSRTSGHKATTDVMLRPGTACGSKATPKATGTTS